MVVMVLLSALRVSGQSTLPDTVCLGETTRYWVTGAANSTYEWKLDLITQPSTTNEIFILWNSLGNFELTVQETTTDNCIGPLRTMPVLVQNDPPTFIPPVLSGGYCMEDITAAVYTPGGTYYGTDLSPPRPDYYLLTQGSTLLDYTTLVNSCPGDLTISWVIDFADATPDLTGSGQISDAIPPGGIQFPLGNNVITWTVTDVAGNITIYSVTLVVLPRPEIGDIPH
jgi:hypothetical protein